MRSDEAIRSILNQIQDIKRRRQTPGSIIVNQQTMFNIAKAKSFNKSAIPYVPSFVSTKDIKYDTLFGLPIAIIETVNNEDFVKVYIEKHN